MGRLEQGFHKDGEISCLLSDLHPKLKRMLRVQFKEFVFYLEENQGKVRGTTISAHPAFWQAWLASFGVSISIAS